MTPCPECAIRKLLREASNLHIRWIGLELEVEPELLPLPELPVLFFRKVAYGLEVSCGEEDIPARNGEGSRRIRADLNHSFIITQSSLQAGPGHQHHLLL